VPIVVSRFAAAASAGDIAAARALIDYPLSGAARVVRALAGVDPRDRERIAGSGLAELDRAASLLAPPDEVRYVLEQLLRRLAGAIVIRCATSAEQLDALDRLLVPDAPRGLSDATKARLDRLRLEVAEVSEIFLISADQREPVAIAVSPRVGRWC
jgi:hypothetical protein